MTNSTRDAIELVDTLATPQVDLSAAQSVISEVKADLDGLHAEQLHTAVRALSSVLDSLEDGHATAEDLVDALR